MKNRIEFVKVRCEVDQDPDLSYLGEYSRLADSDNAIDRRARGDMGHGELQYFNPAMTGEETGNPDSPEQDYQRMEAHNRGAWCMVGVWAEAEFIVGGTVQRIRSGGLWGIESDSDKSYFEEVAREELSSLADILKELGFSTKQVKAAMPTSIVLESVGS